MVDIVSNEDWELYFVRRWEQNNGTRREIIIKGVNKIANKIANNIIARYKKVIQYLGW